MKMILSETLKMPREDTGLIKDSVKNYREDLSDHYYVYGLARPNGEWFYIGKGKGDRVTKHFQAREMKRNSHKARVITKYGRDNIHKEIFGYFECEDAAFELEEFIISEIGLENLTNHVVSSREFGQIVKKSSNWNQALSLRTKYDEDVIVRCYRLYYELGYSTNEISIEMGIPRDYIKYLVRGRARPRLYEKYILGGLIQDRIPDRPVRHTGGQKVSDTELLLYYPDVLAGRVTIKQVADTLGVGLSTIYAVYSGTKRKHLGLNLSRDLKER